MSIPAPRLLACLLLAILCTWLVAWRPFSRPEPDSASYYLRLYLHSSAEGRIMAVQDSGHGSPIEPQPETWYALRGGEFQPAIIKIHSGQLTRLAMVTASTGEFQISGAQICDGNGAVFANISPSRFAPSPDTTFAMEGGALRAKPTTASGECHFDIDLVQALSLPSGNAPGLLEELLDLVIFTVLFLLAVQAIRRRWDTPAIQTSRRHLAELTAKLRSRPVVTLLAISLLAVLLNEFPVAFFGCSLVSPSTHPPLLYVTMPTLPGAPAEPKVDTKYADTAATAWQNVPYSVVEGRALWQDHEIPLWQRYNSCGVTLQGQGQSMLGDPLHAITVLANGAWWAWDIEFILAKTLFAFGIGLAAWEITRRLSLSCLMAASVVWIGFFAYRYNHCAIFSVCYAPLIIVPWLRLKGASSWRSGASWAAALVAADWMEFNSGTVKEASMLLVCVNAAGLLVVLLADQPWREKAAKTALLVWASILFVLLCAPFWLVFLDSLGKAFTVYENPPAYQLQPGLLLALFDGLFSQDFAPQEVHLNPSANFLILTGCLWLLAAWPECRKDRTTLAIALACLPLLALVFGVVPPQWIETTPFLGNIEHIHNTFGVVLIVLLPLLAAAGLKHCLESSRRPGWSAVWGRMAAFGVILFFLFLGFTHAKSRPGALYFDLEPHVSSLFFLRYATCLAIASALLPLALRWSRENGELRFAGIACAAVCIFALHFRHGMYLETKFDGYVMTPRTGFDLVAKSFAVDRVKRHSFEPCRVSGFSGTLWPGYTGAVGIEGICGPDALVNRWYRELYVASNIERLWDWCLIERPWMLSKDKPIFDFLNVRFYLQELSHSEPDPHLLTRLSRSDLDIYESHEVWPRAFFTDGVFEYENAGALVKAIKEGDGRPFAAIQGHDPGSETAPSPTRQVVPAANYKLTNNTTAFSVKAPGPGIVVLTESFEEGNFRVTVNGTPTPYFRVNHAFKGIRVDHAGEYRIQYSYWPKLLTPALWLAAIGVLLAAATAFAIRRLSVSQTPPPATVPVEQETVLADCNA